MEGKKEQTTPFQILRTQVYPTLNEAMLKLIDHIVKTEEVRKHQERLAKQKLLDQLEKKKIQRERQKEQLGSDYFESDDESYYKTLNMNKEQVETILKNRMKKHSKGEVEYDEPVPGDNFNPIEFLIEQLKALKENRSKQATDKQPASN